MKAPRNAFAVLMVVVLVAMLGWKLWLSKNPPVDAPAKSAHSASIRTGVAANSPSVAVGTGVQAPTVPAASKPSESHKASEQDRERSLVEDSNTTDLGEVEFTDGVPQVFTLVTGQTCVITPAARTDPSNGSIFINLAFEVYSNSNDMIPLGIPNRYAELGKATQREGFGQVFLSNTNVSAGKKASIVVRYDGNNGPADVAIAITPKLRP